MADAISVRVDLPTVKLLSRFHYTWGLVHTAMDKGVSHWLSVKPAQHAGSTMYACNRSRLGSKTHAQASYVAVYTQAKHSKPPWHPS